MGIDGSSMASIGPQTWDTKSPLLHVHSDLQCSQLLVTHDLQRRVRSQQDSQPSSIHGHDRQQGALGSLVTEAIYHLGRSQSRSDTSSEDIVAKVPR